MTVELEAYEGKEKRDEALMREKLYDSLTLDILSHNDQLQRGNDKEGYSNGFQ